MKKKFMLSDEKAINIIYLAIYNGLINENMAIDSIQRVGLQNTAINLINSKKTVDSMFQQAGML